MLTFEKNQMTEQYSAHTANITFHQIPSSDPENEDEETDMLHTCCILS
jgi:hypothetical protein